MKVRSIFSGKIGFDKYKQQQQQQITGTLLQARFF
jgi:hypothetical protein